MAKEIGEAEADGEAEGYRVGVQFIDIDPEDQQRFDALYEADGERNALALERFGIDGESIFRRARCIARVLERTGKVSCEKCGPEQ